MNNSFFRKIKGQNLIKVVSGIIKLELHYICTKLSLDHVMKVWKDNAHIRFLLKKKDLRHTNTIINKHNNHRAPKMLRTLKGPQTSLRIKEKRIKLSTSNS